MTRPFFLLLALLACVSCSRSPESAITVSAIGDEARAANPNSKRLDTPAMVMTGALMQGLVQFDARGEIEPALAERWMVTDDGLSYIFRVRRSNWSDGSPVTAAQVAQSLKASIGPKSRNPLRPMLGQITEIIAMTDTVLEIRLSEAQPGLLTLLADPRMAITRNGRGTGPYRLHRSFPSAKILRPVIPVTADDVSEAVLKRSERRVRGESAEMAIARFSLGNAALVLGGDFASFPLLQAAAIQPRSLRIDPVSGLFGLIPTRQTGPAGNRAVRQALAMAIDRAALVQRLGARGWIPTEALMPGPIDRAPEALPDWTSLSRADRLSRAARLIAPYGSGVRVRVALPDGPGSRLLFAQIASDWRPLGVNAQRVRMNEAADFKLVDSVAPTAEAAWYLRPFACETAIMCSPEASTAFSRSRQATREERVQLFAAADRSIADDQLFIPLARPLRWSLVAPQVTGFAENMAGQHPLNRLGSAAN